jgi:hypothetical protein
MDDQAQAPRRPRRRRLARSRTAAALAAADRLLVELEERLWLDDFARALARSQAQLVARWRGN